MKDLASAADDDRFSGRFSVIVPVFNRPQEADELLASLAAQTYADFEVIIVEDGSSVTCREVCSRYANRLKIKYLEKENSGPGPSRNYGAERASGDFLVILDSDVVVPENYFAQLAKALKDNPAEAFGGPDAAHPSFSVTQKAISYAMTSFLTTGGIRGGKKRMDKFYPRSFNMGIAREAFRRLGGFANMRFGEDIDLSIRLFKAGYRCRLIPEAWVWHKRRTDLKKFFRQVFNSGIARIALYKRYPDSLKVVHLLPSAFVAGITLLIVLAVVFAFVCPAVALVCLCPIALFCLAICIDSALRNRSLRVGLMSVPAAFVQLAGYGTGFIAAWWQVCVRGKEKRAAFENTFYN